MSLAAYSMGLCFYVTMPATQQYLAHNGVLTDFGNYADFSTLDTALWRTSLTYGVVTWYVSLFLGDMEVKISDYCCSGLRAWCLYCQLLWIKLKESFHRSLASVVWDCMQWTKSFFRMISSWKIDLLCERDVILLGVRTHRSHPLLLSSAVRISMIG